MRLGIGIDTGGTFTDAVIWELDEKKVLSAYKARTTHDNLSVGIINALDGLNRDLVKQAQIVCLSTTLATNACVENKVTTSKLLFIGVNPKAVAWVGAEAGLDDPQLICYAADESWTQPEDWTQFLESHRQWFKDTRALGIVALNAERDQGACERAARSAILARYDFPVICGYELGDERNSIRRGASALLNGGLIRVITEFVAAVRVALDARQITAPIAIMSSDGTLMPSQFTQEHPVETILCGPAASVMGGSIFADAPNSIIVDMGGTTTDIALVRNGVPVKAGQGIQIGGWRTAVKGVLVRTLGLGGDSAIRVDRRTHRLFLDQVRVVPLCSAAEQYPQIITKLEDLLSQTQRHTIMLHEFLIRVHEIADSDLYTQQEKKLCHILGEGPLSLREAADVLGVDVYNLHLERLEQEKIIIRCGLTPTDIMRLKGDISVFSEDAARLGAQFVANCVGLTVEDLCDRIYNEIGKKLYLNIGQMLLQEQIPMLKRQGIGEQVNSCLENIWDANSTKASNHVELGLTTNSVLVGVGAPIHVFLPKVAKAFGAKCIIPEHAAVVNAIGAVACNVSASRTVQIRCEGQSYYVPTEDGIKEYKNYPDAIAQAREGAEKIAREAVLSRGAVGELLTQCHIEEKTAAISYGGEIFLGADVTVTVSGSPGFTGR